MTIHSFIQLPMDGGMKKGIECNMTLLELRVHWVATLVYKKERGLGKATAESHFSVG